MDFDSSSFADPKVADAFAAFPLESRTRLFAIRALILDIAASDAVIGPLQETLKWGQPAYLTAATKSGSTIRLGIPKHGGAAIYTHCQTTLMADFQELFPNDFTFEGNRAVYLPMAGPLPLDKLTALIYRALTYHA